MYGFCYIHMHYQTGLFISPMNVCSSNKFCACNLFTLIDTPAVSSCSTKLPFFTNLSLSNFVGFSYSFLTPASVVWLLSFLCCSSYLSSLSSDLCPSSSISADCSSPSCTSAHHLFPPPATVAFHATGYPITISAFPSSNPSLSYHIFYLFYPW